MVTTVEDAAPEAAAGAVSLERLLACVHQANQLWAEAVAVAGRLAGSGECERVEGLPLEQWLGLAGGLTGADRRLLVAAGETLADLPQVAAAFAAGQVSWGQVRSIVAAARRLSKAARAELDALLDATDAAVAELTDAARVEQNEQQRVERSFCAVQSDFAGGIRYYGEEGDPAAAASIVAMLDAAAARPRADGTDAGQQQDGATDPAGRDWTSTTRARDYAEALRTVAAAYLAGVFGGRARPLLIAHVDIGDAIAAQTAGTVELGVRGPTPRISAAAAEALACDADLRVALFDGARPLAVSAKQQALAVPTEVRLAAEARDGGCRFAGCNVPASQCDLHHIHEQGRGGDHHPDNVVLLCRRHHRLVHRRGWRLLFHPDDGRLEFRRRRRRYHSMPHGTPLVRPPRPPPDVDAAGTGSDPPSTDAAPTGLPF